MAANSTKNRDHNRNCRHISYTTSNLRQKCYVVAKRCCCVPPYTGKKIGEKNKSFTFKFILINLLICSVLTLLEMEKTMNPVAENRKLHTRSGIKLEQLGLICIRILQIGLSYGQTCCLNDHIWSKFSLIRRNFEHL